MNGRMGAYMGRDPSSGRLMVCIDPADPPEQWKKLKPENVVRGPSWEELMDGMGRDGKGGTKKGKGKGAARPAAQRHR